MTETVALECQRTVRRLENLPLGRLEAASPLVREALSQIVALENQATGASAAPPAPTLEALPSALAALVFDASRNGASDDDVSAILHTLRQQLP